MVVKRSIWMGAVLVVLVSPASRLGAVIKREYPLKAVLRDSQFVLEARVVRLDAARKRLVAEVVKDFKGKLPFRRLNINLARGQKGDPERMLKRLRLGLPLVIFGIQDKEEVLFVCFSEGTWFSMTSGTAFPRAGTRGSPSEKKPPAAICAFKACEIYLRRTYAGATKALLELLPEVLAGGREPPPYDPKVKPGLGPEVKRAGNC